MKKIISLILLITSIHSFGQNDFKAKNIFRDSTLMLGKVGIGTVSPAASSALDITSTTKGLLIPRMTYANRDAISSPATGLLTFNTQTNKFNWYTGSAWLVVGDSTSAGGGSSYNLANFYLKDSALSSNRTVDINSRTLDFTGTSTNLFNVTNTSTGNAIKATSVDGYAFRGISNTQSPLSVTRDAASTNTNERIAIFERTSSGTVANDISGSLDVWLERISSSSSLAGKFVVRWSNATAFSETSEVDIVGIDNSSEETFMNVQKNLIRGNNNADTVAWLRDIRAIHSEATYTPTLTNTTNIAASTAYTTYFKRVGDWVHVWGDVSIDATTALTISEFGLSLPIASALTSTADLAGTAAYEDNTIVQIKGDVANARAMFRFTPQTATNNKYSFHFTYEYIAP